MSVYGHIEVTSVNLTDTHVFSDLKFSNSTNYIDVNGLRDTDQTINEIKLTFMSARDVSRHFVVC